MKAKEYLEKHGYPEADQGEGYVLNVSELSDLLNGFTKLKTKELIEENSRMKLQLNDDGDLPPVNIEGEKIGIIKGVFHRIKTNKK